jgi:23S rRNA pseudouridine1911/1915/1917 synthase
MDSTPPERHSTFTADQPGQRLDVAIAAVLTDLSRSQIQRLIKSEMVLVDGRPAKPAYRIEGGEVISVRVPVEGPLQIGPEAIPLDVLYEDADLVAINKPAGMVVHPAHGHTDGTLVNAALACWPGIADVGGQGRAGVVHRLDKDTSGVIVVAKTEAALQALQAQFRARAVHKRYLALVDGIPESNQGIIEAPLGRDPRQRKRIAVLRDGRPALTAYRLLEAFDHHALLEIEPKTGRTHQIRVHLAWLGYPVVGDQVYGWRRPSIKLGRHFLHAVQLAVNSPSTGERLDFVAPLPSDLADTLNKLRSRRKSPGG